MSLNLDIQIIGKTYYTGELVDTVFQTQLPGENKIVVVSPLHEINYYHK